MENILEVKHLKKSYGSGFAVDDVSFSIEKGEIFALIGPNGAGKSTTLKMIVTLLSPTSGEINVCGHDVVKQADKVREAISYLPEDSGAYKNLTGIEYLGIMAGLYSDDAAEQRKFVEKGKEISGLGERLKDKASTYSKGMARKLLLARTVMIEPKLAILDEPTSGLDVINAMEIREIIKGLAKAGMTVLLSSHNMLEIEFLADRVAIIDSGKIHEIGTVKGLKDKYGKANLEEVFVEAVKPSFTKALEDK